LDDWLSLRAVTHPQGTAVVGAGEALTYAALAARAAASARRLAALGIGPGDRVATTLPSGSDFASLIHAMPLLGAVLVPLNVRLPLPEQRRMAAEAGVRLTISEPLVGAEADVPLRATVDADRPWTLLHTSGTGGRPKPVLLTYRNHTASAIASAWNLGVDPADRWLSVLPLFHVGGLAILIRSAVYGTTAVLEEGFEPAAVARWIADDRITLLSLVPTMLRRLLDHGVVSESSLRAVLIGGGPVPSELLARATAAGLPVIQTYGMTETASQIATLSAADALAGREGAGRALPGVELRIGEQSRIEVRGPMVARAEAGGDGWLHTSDRGRLDAEGFLHVDGRLDAVIVTGGENVAAEEVEEALLAHPAVSDAAVVGMPDPEWGRAVTAFVVLSEQVSDADLLAHARTRLAPFKLPKAVHRRESLPRNAAGKLIRRGLI